MDVDRPEDILRFARQKKMGAEQFYARLADVFDDEELCRLFRWLKEKERGHVEAIESEMNRRAMPGPADGKFHGAIGPEDLFDVFKTGDFTVKDALEMAFEREHAAWMMYINLMKRTEDIECAKTLIRLAEDEVEHKLCVKTVLDGHMEKNHDR